MRFFLILTLFLPAFVSAQTCLCCKKRESGQAAYDRKDYQSALTRWKEGLALSDAADYPELKSLVAKAKAKLNPPKPADRDGDGITGKYDLCPDLPGFKSNQGCPQPNPAPNSMVLIKGGTFTMGDLFGEGSDDETRHSVTISDFYLGKTEVTFEDFDAFCSDTNREQPDDSGWGRGQRPVINVDWYDAVEYCNWLSQKEHKTPAYTIDKIHKDPKNTNIYDSKIWTVRRDIKANGYRLPTEAEWEYAAREGGKQVRFGNGKDLADPKQIDFDPSEKDKQSYSIDGEYRQKTVEVSSLNSPNALGLHHMSGNVSEWCADWYWDYPSSASNDPIGPEEGDVHLHRGGDWHSPARYCRLAFRSYDWPSNSSSSIGFRLAHSN